jgi:phosphatidate cytidylyltransferase
LNKPEFFIRSGTGLIIALVTLGAIMLSPWTYLIWLCLIVFLGAHEYFRLERFKINQTFLWAFPLCLVTLIGLAGFYLHTEKNLLLPLLVIPLLPLIIFLVDFWVYKNSEQLLKTQLAALSVTTYLGLPGLCGCVFLISEYRYEFLLVPIILIWLNDVGAYLIGSQWGKNKIAPTISPGKSIEGTIGGGVLTLITGYVLTLAWPELPLGYIIMLSLTTPFFALAGDLWESLLKRKAGVKDSGKILPGHGGILDRYDSFLFVLPVAAFAYFIFAL